MGIIMETKEKANELVDRFYLCMPFKDTKLTYCGETPELIVDMEKLAAKQCALIAQKMLLHKLAELGINDEFENNVLLELNAL